MVFGLLMRVMSGDIDICMRVKKEKKGIKKEGGKEIAKKLEGDITNLRLHWFLGSSTSGVKGSSVVKVTLVTLP